MIVADPPWQSKDKLPGKRGAAANYQTLSVPEIMRYPLPPIADEAILFLWSLSSMQQEALDVIKAWGFRPKTQLSWVKLSRTGEKMHIGMGRILRGAHEPCLVAARGRYRPLVLDRGMRTVLLAQVPRNDDGGILHSGKPDEFYSLVEKGIEGPRVELFARERRAGWTQFGDQLPGGQAHP